MIQSLISRKATLVGGLAALALGSCLAPAIAAAQPAPPPPPTTYDQCERARQGNGVAGAIIGGILGGLLGSNIAAGGHRTGGTLVGAGVGAVGGAVVGSNTTDCGPPPPLNAYRGPQPSAGEDRYDSRYYADRSGYDAGPPPPPRQSYDDRYGDQGAPPQGYDDNRCTEAPSPIYMPDGTVERHYVRVCRDPDGRYHVAE